MQSPRFGLVVSFAAMLVCLSAAGAGADVFNLRLLSNHAPDLTDLESFCASATSRWTTNDEKAAALAHWFGVMGNQSDPPCDWIPVEPILHFNNFMNANCAYWTALYAAVGEGGLGWVGRHYEVGDHTVPELEYDGGRHYLDNTYKFFPVKCDGRTILGITEMDEAAGPCAKGPEGRYHWLCYHTPQAITRDRDGYAPGKAGQAELIGDDTTRIRGWLTGSWLPRDAAGRAYFAQTLDEAWVKRHWNEWNTQGCHSIYRYRLGLRPGESYTRYWEPLGTTSDYYYPNGQGKDPNSYLKDRGRSNGRWIFTPDLQRDAAFESARNTARSSQLPVHPARAGEEAEVVFKVQSANITTGVIVEADLYRRSEKDAVAIEASCDAGHSWFPVWEARGTGELHVKQNISDALCGTHQAGDLRVVLNYLVRVRMKAAQSPSDAALKAITVTTITQCNRQALPRLDLGTNCITVDYDPRMQYETLSVRPLLKNDLYRRYAVDSANIGTSQRQGTLPVAFADSTTDEAHVTFQLDAPRPVLRFRMGGSIWLSGRAESNYVRYEYRLRGPGGQWNPWQTAGAFDFEHTRDNYHQRRNQNKYLEVPVSQADVTSVQFRYVFRTRHTSKYHRTGASLLRMELDYQAPDTAFRPIEVTYNWTEYYEPLPEDESGGTVRSHTERISRLPHRYRIHVGGHVRPHVNWVRINLEGSSPEPVTLGYSDGKDVGARDAIPPVRYTWGRLLSLNKPYTVSVSPRKGAFRVEGDEQELTDGYIKEPQSSGTTDTGLAHWPRGVDTLEVTVDLGEVRSVGGGRVDGYIMWGGVRFPNSVEIRTSADGRTFTTRGRDRHKSARYAHNGWPANWPLHPRHDAPESGPFPDFGLKANYIFVPFEKPVRARYVKFMIQARPGSGFQLTEVNVWDSLKAVPWTPRLAHDPGEF